MSVSSRPGFGVIFALLIALLLVDRDALCTDPVEPWKEWQRWEFELERLGHPVDTDSLSKIVIEDEDLLVRSLAAWVLGARGESSAVPTLKKVAKSDSSSSVRQAAAWALAALEVPEGLVLLKEYLNEAPDLESKLSAAFALADFGDLEGYEFVLAAAESDKAWIRMDVAAGVHRFLKEGEVFAPKQSPSLLVLRLVEDPNSHVRRLALSQFGEAARVTDRVEEFLGAATRLATEDPSPQVREEARRILSVLKTAIKDGRVVPKPEGEGSRPSPVDGTS